MSVDNHPKGTAFLVGAGMALTARHVIKTALDENDRHRAGCVVTVDFDGGVVWSAVVEKCDSAMDVAVLRGVAVGSAGAYGCGTPVQGTGWRVSSRFLANDPVLTGTVTDPARTIQNAQGHDTELTQLHVEQDLGGYQGYSGSPVWVTGPGQLGRLAVGLMVEQTLLRVKKQPGQGPNLATNVLWAAPLPTVLVALGLSDEIPLTPSIDPGGVVQDPAPIFARVRTDHFVGRTWVIEDLDRFLLENKSGYFFVEGKAGLGKTALLAYLVSTRRWFHHFVELTPGDAGIDAARRSIAGQLIRAFDLNDSGGASDASAQATTSPDYLGRVFTQAADRCKDHERIVIVVDALDEAATRSDENVLGLPRTLPAGVFVIASKRPVPVRLVLVDTRRRVVTLKAESAENLRDVRAYLESFVARRPNKGSNGDLVGTLTRKSRGVWVYLHYVVSAIEQADSDGLEYDADRLPDGLWRYYANYWMTWSQDHHTNWSRLHLPVLAALTATLEAVPISVLCDFVGLGVREDDVATLLDRHWRPFVVAVPDEHGNRRYVLYHASLREFLSGAFDRSDLFESDRDFVDDLVSRTRRTHGSVADFFLERWGGLGAGLPRLADTADPDPLTAYGLHHLASHLAAAGRRDDLLGLLTKRWMDAKVIATRTPSAFAEDVNLALRSARQPPADLNQETRCRLILGLTGSLVAEVPAGIFGVLAAGGEVDKAFAYASLPSRPLHRAAAHLAIGHRLADASPEQALLALSAVELDKVDEVMRIDLAMIAARAGEPERARAIVQQTIGADSGDSGGSSYALSEMIGILTDGGWLSEARQLLGRVGPAAWDGGAPAALRLMSACARTGDLAVALSLADQAWRPVRGAAFAALLADLQRQGADRAELLAIVERLEFEALNADEQDWAAWPLRAHLAAALLLIGNDDAAQHHADRAVEGAGRHPDLVERAWSLAGVSRVLAAAGDLQRAERSAQAILVEGAEDSVRRIGTRAAGRAQAGLAVAYAAAGDAERALALLAESERAQETRSAGGGFLPDYTLPEIVHRMDFQQSRDRIDVLVALNRSGQVERVRTEIESDPELTASVIQALATAGDVQNAESLSQGLDVTLRGRAAIAEGLLNADRPVQALRAANDVLDRAARQTVKPDLRVAADLALTAAAIPGHRGCDRLMAWLMPHTQTPGVDVTLMALVVEVLMALREVQRAEELAERTLASAPAGRVVRLVEKLASTGDGSTAAKVASRLGPLTSSQDVSGDLTSFPLPRLVKALSDAGQTDAAEALVARALAQAGVDPADVASARARCTEAYVVLGRPDLALPLTVDTVNPWYEAPAIALVAESFAGRGEAELARQAGESAITAVRSMGNSWARGGTARAVTEFLARADLVELAGEAVSLVNVHPDHAFALCDVAEALARNGRTGEGIGLARDAVSESKNQSADAVLAGALTLLRLGEADEAETLINAAIAAAAAETPADLRVSRQSALADQFIRFGLLARAAEYARRIDVSGAPRPGFKAWALVRAAQAVVASDGDVTAAVDLVTDALAVLDVRSAPGFGEVREPRVLIAAMESYRQAGRSDLALDVWRRALAAGQTASGLAGVLEAVSAGGPLLLEAGADLLDGVIDTVLDVYDNWLEQT